jgi:hypothetical protein
MTPQKNTTPACGALDEFCVDDISADPVALRYPLEDVITDCHHFALLIAELNIRGCSAFPVVDGGNRIDGRNGVSDEYGFDEPYPIITKRNRGLLHTSLNASSNHHRRGRRHESNQ